MATNRKLNLPTDRRNALLRNQVTALLWNGKIETTETRAKEVRRIAERLITLAVKEYNNTTAVKRELQNQKGETITRETTNDLPSKLHARRKMMAYVYDIQEPKQKGENRTEYKKRTEGIAHPLIEKMFSEYGPKYDKIAQEKGQKGGYTRILKMGPRRGDATEMVILELV